MAATLQAATATDLSAAPAHRGQGALRRELHLVLKQVSYDYERMQYNTVVSGCMKLLNAPWTLSRATTAQATTPCCARRRVAADPLAVSRLPAHHPQPVVRAGLRHRPRRPAGRAWPQVDESALVQDEIELVLQVNGKLRGGARASWCRQGHHRSRRPGLRSSRLKGERSHTQEGGGGARQAGQRGGGDGYPPAHIRPPHHERPLSRHRCPHCHRPGALSRQQP